MPVSLTAVAVRNAKAIGGTRREIPDGGTGLYLVIQPSGAKSWALRYRFDGKPVKLTLGPALVLEAGEAEGDEEPALGRPLTLRGARALASVLGRRIQRGDDPAAQQRSLKAAKHEPGATADLFEVAALQFIERYAKGQNRESSWRETARLLGFKIDPANPSKLVRRKAVEGAFPGVAHYWTGKRLGDIRRRDVIDLLDSIADGGAPFSANRTFAAIRKLFNWSIERDLLAVSPCEGVRLPTAEPPRERVLDDKELAMVWRAADALGEPFGQFVKLLILTGQRRNEVAKMQWSELSTDGETLLLSTARAKNHTAHDVPLSTQAQGVLGTLKRVSGKPDYVFTTGSVRRIATTDDHVALAPISGFSKAKISLDKAIHLLEQRDAEANGTPVEGLPPMKHWRFHDLRRTVASGMAKIGISLPVIEKVLNHKSGSFAGIVGVYQRHSYADEKRAALQAWGNFVGGLALNAPDNVLSMTARRR